MSRNPPTGTSRYLSNRGGKAEIAASAESEGAAIFHTLGRIRCRCVGTVEIKR